MRRDGNIINFRSEDGLSEDYLSFPETKKKIKKNHNDHRKMSWKDKLKGNGLDLPPTTYIDPSMTDEHDNDTRQLFVNYIKHQELKELKERNKNKKIRHTIYIIIITVLLMSLFYGIFVKWFNVTSECKPTEETPKKNAPNVMETDNMLEDVSDAWYR